MKIAHIQLFPLLSGVQRVSLEEIVRRKSIDDYTLVCKEPGPLSEMLDEQGVAIHFVPYFCRQLSPLNDLLSLFFLWRIFRKEKYDVVHTHSSKTGVLGRIAAKLAGCKKVVHTVHGFSFPAARTRYAYFIYFLMEWIAKWFTSVLIVLTENDKNIAINKLGFAAHKVRLLPNGVDISEVPNQVLNKQKDIFRVVMVGRLDKQKDPHTFIMAAIILSKKYANVCFDLIGDGEYREELELLIKSEGQQGKVKMLLWRNDVRELLTSYDIFVLSSRWEGMPLAILEAQATGLPVVVTDIPGNRDLVREGVDGYTFPPGNVDYLIKNIERYYFDRGLIQAHGDSAYKKILDHYSIDVRLSKLTDIYTEN